MNFSSMAKIIVDLKSTGSIGFDLGSSELGIKD